MLEFTTPRAYEVQYGDTVKVVTTLPPKDIYWPHTCMDGCRHCRRLEYGKDECGIFFGVVLPESDIPLQCNSSDTSRMLVLSLSRQSPPFSAGHVVWIKESHIRSVTVTE